MKGEGLEPQERIERGRRASAMLKDEVFQEAIESARQALITSFLDSPTFDEKKALAAWATNKSLDVIEEDLRRTESDGQFAAQPSRKLQ